MGLLQASHAATRNAYSEDEFTTLDGYQVTEVIYGADIVKPDFASATPVLDVMSGNNQWIREIRFPGDEDPTDLASY
ncbi:MAG: hypothetical protein AAFX79_01510 [Planctomycetota bacterium]